MSGETKDAPLGWTTDLLNRHLTSIMDERDRRYTERFDAQQQAVVVALAAVDKEFHEHLEQVRVETKAALDASEKAINKAESATNERFHSVNEFRAQLADQVTTFIPRKEAEQGLDSAFARIDSIETRFTETLSRVHSRLDLGEGNRQGNHELRGLIFAAAGFVSAVVAVAFAFIK